MKNSVFYQPVLKISLKSTQDLPAARFVGYNGGLCSSGAKAIGATDKKWSSDKIISLVVLGTAAVESVGSINAGDNLASDANGRAVVATGTAAVNARALESTTNGGIIKVLLVA